MLPKTSMLEALKVFEARGVVAAGDMTAGDLRAAYVRLALAAHPDRGGAPGEMQLINEAYQVLKKMAVHEDPQAQLIRKQMRQLSGDAGEQWRVRGFDGHFFRRDVTVLGHPRIFRQMAEAVRLWQTSGVPSLPCRAVFVQKPTVLEQVLLVYADGKFYADKPIPMKPVSGDEASIGDVTNDPLFVRWLPFTLNQLARDGVV
jgi:hypothetical protein